MIPSALTSTRNPRIRAAASLRSRRARDETGLTLVDGIREISRALGAGARVRELFAVDDPDPTLAATVETARDAGASIVTVDRRVVDHLGYGERSEGLVAVIEIPSTTLSAIRLSEDPLVVVLEGIEKPGNLGAVLRTADATGAACVISADARTDMFNPNTIRASLATVFTVPVASESSDVARSWLREHGLRIVSARVDGAVAWSDAELTGPVAIVLGSEADGLTDAWSGDEIESVRLPMLGAADSLNVSITAAVLLVEARRQRLQRPRSAGFESRAATPGLGH